MIYEFHCNDCCNNFEKMLKLSERDTSQKCSLCGSEKTKRCITAPVYMDENTDFGSPYKTATKKALDKIHQNTAGSTLNKTMDI